MSVVLLHN